MREQGEKVLQIPNIHVKESETVAVTGITLSVLCKLIKSLVLLPHFTEQTDTYMIKASHSKKFSSFTGPVRRDN